MTEPESNETLDWRALTCYRPALSEMRIQRHMPSIGGPEGRLVSAVVFWMLGMLWMASFVEGVEVLNYDVSSRFEPAEVSLGQECLYIVTIRRREGDPESRLTIPPQPELPAHAHLTFGRYQTSEEYMSSMGMDPGGIRLEFKVNPNFQGRIIMPAFRMPYQGGTLGVPATVLKVAEPDTLQREARDDWVRLELEDPSDELWVGQRVRATLNLLILDGLQNVTYGKPEKIGNDVALESISPSPIERLVTRGDLRYRVYSWPLTYSPLRSGIVRTVFRISVNLRMPNDRDGFLRWVRDQNGASLLERERLLQDFTESSFTVFSEDRDVRVTSLGMPDAETCYYGGVGKFEMVLTLSETEMEVEKPVDLTIEIGGQGNFSKLEAPVLHLGDSWRVFPPQSEFKDEDFLGYRGKVKYQYVLIPLESGLDAFPPVAYRYFDVETKSFRDLASEPVAIRVSGKSLVRNTEAVESPVIRDPVQEGGIGPAVVPFEVPVARLRWEMSDCSVFDMPLFTKPWFWLWQLLPFASLAGFAAWRIHRIRLKVNQRYAREEQARGWMHHYLRLAKAAAAKGDSDVFFEDAYLSLCASVAVLGSHHVEAMTSDELAQLMELSGSTVEMNRIAEYYVTQYEQSRFSGSRADTPPLKPEYERVSELCSILMKSSVKARKKGGRA